MTDHPTEDLSGRDDDWMPGVSIAEELDDEQMYVLDPDFEDVPIVDVSTLPSEPPSEGVGYQDGMDDSELEGLGAGGARDEIWRRAVPRARQKVGADNKIGYCLQEIRIINETESKYLDAKQSLYAADVKWPVLDWSKVIRGTIGYFDGPTHDHGHIYENVGGGWIISTDVPTGKWGRVRGEDLMFHWNYPHAYSSPFVNDNRVGYFGKKSQKPPKPTPAERRVKELEAWRGELEKRHRAQTQQGDHTRARVLQRRIRFVTSLIHQVRNH